MPVIISTSPPAKANWSIVMRKTLSMSTCPTSAMATMTPKAVTPAIRSSLRRCATSISSVSPTSAGKPPIGLISAKMLMAASENCRIVFQSMPC